MVGDAAKKPPIAARRGGLEQPEARYSLPTADVSAGSYAAGPSRGEPRSRAALRSRGRCDPAAVLGVCGPELFWRPLPTHGLHPFGLLAPYALRHRQALGRAHELVVLVERVARDREALSFHVLFPISRSTERSTPVSKTRHYTLSDLYVSLTGEAMIAAAERILAEEAAQRRVGIHDGFEIPASPIPATKAECLVEIAELTELQHEAYEAVMRLPPGPEREFAGLAMVYYRDRRIWLACAIRDGEVE